MQVVRKRKVEAGRLVIGGTVTQTRPDRGGAPTLDLTDATNEGTVWQLGFLLKCFWAFPPTYSGQTVVALVLTFGEFHSILNGFRYMHSHLHLASRNQEQKGHCHPS